MEEYNRLQVLVMDEDLDYLKMLHNMLLQCGHQVYLAQQASNALQIVSEKKIDLAIADAHMPDMDAFQLTKIISKERRIPIVMMSRDMDKELVKECMQNGVSDFLIKPLKMEEVQIIWKNLYRCAADDHMNSANDPKDANNRIDKEYNASEEGRSSSKKQRISWAPELHDQFLSAVSLLGIDRAVPKRILELMKVPGLSRENVASHLQKYRKSIRRTTVVQQQQHRRPARTDLGNIENRPMVNEIQRSLVNGIWNHRPRTYHPSINTSHERPQVRNPVMEARRAPYPMPNRSLYNQSGNHYPNNFQALDQYNIDLHDSTGSSSLRVFSSHRQSQSMSTTPAPLVPINYPIGSHCNSAVITNATPLNQQHHGNDEIEEYIIDEPCDSNGAASSSSSVQAHGNCASVGDQFLQ